MAFVDFQKPDYDGFIGLPRNYFYGVTREQLVIVGILIGTDFNPGIEGIGAKTALELIKQHGRIEELPREVLSRLDENFNEVRKIFLEPSVTLNYSLQYSEPRRKQLIRFLCIERGFNRKRVETVAKRMERVYEKTKQSNLERWARM